MKLHRHWYRAIADTSMLSGLVFTSDSANLISAGGEPHGIRFWDVERGEASGILAGAGANGRITTLALHPAGKVLAIGHEDGAIHLRDIIGNTSRTLPNAPESEVMMLAFSPDGRYLASGSLDNTLRCWDMDDVSALHFSLHNHCWSDQSIAYSPDGRYIATIDDDDSVCLWELETAQRIAVFHDAHVESSVVAFHPGGEYIAIAGVEQTITFWYPQQDRAETLFTGYNTSPSSLSFDQTGEYLFLGMFSDDYPLRVWDMQQRCQSSDIAGDSDEGCHIVISPDGRFLACRATGNTASIEVWRLLSE